MTSRKEIAKEAARVAALETYKAIMNGPTQKVAGTSFKASISLQDIAKTAAAASYSSVLKLAQVMSVVPIDFRSLSGILNSAIAMKNGYPKFAAWALGSGGPLPDDATSFAAYIKSGLAPYNWARAERWPEIVTAVMSNVADKTAGAQLLPMIHQV